MRFSKSIFILSVFALLLPAFVWAAYPAEVARTGQTICYDASGAVISCAGTGQDGDWLAGAPWPDPRFIDNGAGTITDKLTGLVWSQNANLPNGTKTWQEALDYVAGMNAGTNPNLGYTDWRLPNVNEFESLVNAQLSHPALPFGHPFANVQSDTYWSSTSYAYNTVHAWMVDMNGGYVVNNYKSGSGFVWPVRAGQCGSLGNSIICLPKTGQTSCYNSAGTSVTCSGAGQDGEIQAGVAWPSLRFVDNGETVTDSLTGLVWTKNANLAGSTKTWQQALDYVKTLNTGSHGDWRLPNERELRSLADYSKYGPALPTGHPFTNVQSDTYWSSTTYASSTNNAWIVDMNVGNVYYDHVKAYFYYVWPVRAGQVVNSIISSTTTTTQLTSTTTTTQLTTTTTHPTTTTIIGSGTTTTTAPPQFTVYKNVVSDSATGLLWARNGDTGQKTWAEAFKYCGTLALSGCDGWRLPTLSELQSLVNVEASSPAAWLNKQDFKNVQPDQYWTSTLAYPELSISTVVYCVDFSGGRRFCISPIQVGNYVLPVRSGQCESFNDTPVVCPALKLLGEGDTKLDNLRSFRDSSLVKNAIGRKLIQIYYNNADSINAALERSPALRAVTRKVLEVIAPMVGG